MSLFIPGPAGALEAAYSPNTDPSQPLVIICHPHPQHGGTMTNKVVTSTHKAMAALGLSTLRFNYRGVGQSEGSFDNQVGEVDDTLAVLEWALAQGHEQQPLWIAGFSFGAYIAARVANDRPNTIQQLLTLAPVLSHSDYTTLTDIRCPWHAIVGSDDDFVSVAELTDYQRTHPVPLSLEVIEPACHYFHGQLIQLRDHIISHYTQYLSK